MSTLESRIARLGAVIVACSTVLVALPEAADAAPIRSDAWLQRAAEREARDCIRNNTERRDEINTVVYTVSACFAGGFIREADISAVRYPPAGTLGPVQLIPLATVQFGCDDAVISVTCTADLCAEDADCEAHEWCGFLNDGGRQCKPYAEAGETCGGFTLPEYYEVCHPELQCVTDPYIADAPGECATCNYGGIPYMAGDTFAADDGCNTCSCSEGGFIACTEMACISK